MPLGQPLHTIVGIRWHRTHGGQRPRPGRATARSSGSVVRELCMAHSLHDRAQGGGGGSPSGGSVKISSKLLSLSLVTSALLPACASDDDGEDVADTRQEL